MKRREEILEKQEELYKNLFDISEMKEKLLKIFSGDLKDCEKVEKFYDNFDEEIFLAFNYNEYVFRNLVANVSKITGDYLNVF